jgi:hypothetical protein
METDKPTDWETRPVNHVCIVDRRADRRIMAKESASHTHCGADRTGYDLTIGDARRDPSWIKCPTCRVHAGGSK